MDKKQMRNDMLHQLNKFSEQEHAKLSRIIQERFIATEEFKHAQTIGITISRSPEVDTRPIIEAAWSAGKQVVVPKCNAGTREMDFRRLKTYDDLEIVYNGLLEPIVSRTESVPKDEIDIQVVPGVIFSDNGYRVGYGGGYYDRYMSDFKGPSMALAFDVQTNKLVPIEAHDVPVKKIMTEIRMIDCEKGKNSN